MKKLTYLILLLLVSVTGCAKTVTDKTDAGSELNFVINFASSISSVGSDYRYYIVFPKNVPVESLAPINDEDIEHYHFGAPALPGGGLLDFYDGLVNYNSGYYIDNKILVDTPTSDPVVYFFDNYFQNWNDYIVLDTNDRLARMYHGPFPAGSSSTFNIDYDNSASKTWRSSGTQLSFTVDLADLSTVYVKGDTIPFFMFTTKKDGDLIVLYDWLLNINGLTNSQGSLAEDTDGSILAGYDNLSSNDELDAAINGSIDIIEWTVSIL